MNTNIPADERIDTDGADLHHGLKNQPGEKGDADHATSDATPAEDIDASLKEAVADVDDDTAIASALKKAVKE
ncbi:hypothetical protein [Jannaschia sp. CCS1]|uniref:hypothetical protein n=1 Tax=Jannaschia sp. (strain CCS1) TaxID=290400 RepID=UPI0002EBB2C7|nr:hypothetical protein [Jannaschia sp. CCS1]